MTLLTTASRAGRVVRNAGRMREILTMMSRFGFGTLVNQMGLRRFSLHRSTPSDLDFIPENQRSLPIRLRLLIEQLGPTFIKVGQILSGRPDLIPAEFISELEKLQDRTTPLDFALLKPPLEEALGKPLEECFLSFDTEAMASASIAQVHAARTLDGQDVVVKIQKPGVEKTLNQDLQILELIAEALENYVPELRAFRPLTIVQEFRRSVNSELSFAREAQSIRRFQNNFKESNFLVVPKVFSELSRDTVLTMERLRGVKLSNLRAVQELGLNPSEILARGMDCFFQAMLVDGFFHGDPHPGNIIVLPDGRMGLIDFGAMGYLSFKSKSSLINMFLALIDQDYDSLVREYIALSPARGAPRPSAEVEALQFEISALFTPYYGVSLNDIPSAKLLLESTSVALRYQIFLPRDLVMVFKTIVTLEAMGRALDPHFDLFGAATKYSKIVIRQRLDPKRVMKDLLFFGRDSARLIQSAPRQLSSTLRQLESGEFRINVNIAGIEKHTKAQYAASSRISFALMASALLYAAVQLSQSADLAPWAIGSIWALSLATIAWGMLKSFRH